MTISNKNYNLSRIARSGSVCAIGLFFNACYGAHFGQAKPHNVNIKVALDNPYIYKIPSEVTPTNITWRWNEVETTVYYHVFLEELYTFLIYDQKKAPNGNNNWFHVNAQDGKPYTFFVGARNDVDDGDIDETSSDDVPGDRIENLTSFTNKIDMDAPPKQEKEYLIIDTGGKSSKVKIRSEIHPVETKSKILTVEWLSITEDDQGHKVTVDTYRIFRKSYPSGQETSNWYNLKDLPIIGTRGEPSWMGLGSTHPRTLYQDPEGIIDPQSKGATNTFYVVAYDKSDHLHAIGAYAIIFKH